MQNKISIRVPATSANCGPGFDSLGLACNLYNYFTYELLEAGLELNIIGEGAQTLYPSKDNLAFASFFRLWSQSGKKDTGLRVSMHNIIPLSRGLGSSSAAIVAGLLAADFFLGGTSTKQDLLSIATEMEGHPDNVAPALFGGITISYVAEGKVSCLKFLPKKELRLIAVIPDMPLATSMARAAIPASVPHEDAVFNASRTALLVAALLTGESEHLCAALEDRLHHPYRAPLIPGMQEAFAAARRNGAYNAVISGAGSTLMAYAAPTCDCVRIAAAMQSELQAHGISSAYHLLALDLDGASVMDA